MTDELCEEDIRKAFESGRLQFERADGGFRATLVDYEELRAGDPIAYIEFTVREERGTSYGGVVMPVYAVEITSKRSVAPQQTTRVCISQSLFEAIRYNVQEADRQCEIRFKKHVKAMLTDIIEQTANNS